MSATYVLDLHHYRTPGVKVFSGRDRGAYVRDQASLFIWDCLGCDVEVRVPDDAYALCGGFLDELLGPSVTDLGEAEFRRRYTFTAPAHLHRGYEEMIAWRTKIGRENEAA